MKNLRRLALLARTLVAKPRVAMAMIIIGTSAPAFADDIALPACGDLLKTTPIGVEYGAEDHQKLQHGCTFSWVEKGALRRFDWHMNEFENDAPVLRFSPRAGYALTSQQPPELIDINRNGSRDLVLFNPIGMVNGDLDVFLFESYAGSYSHAGTLFGHTLLRENNGYLVVIGRSGPGQRFDFYNTFDRLIENVFSLIVQSECTLSARGRTITGTISADEIPAFLLADTDMISRYCNVFENEQSGVSDTAFNVPLQQDPDITFVAPNTIFHCPIEGSDNVASVTQDASGYLYRYGPKNGAPDLEIRRTTEEVETVHQRIAKDGSLLDEIRFVNGAYTYIPFAKTVIIESGDAIPQRGLRVMQAGQDGPIFDKLCDVDASFALLQSNDTF